MEDVRGEEGLKRGHFSSEIFRPNPAKPGRQAWGRVIIKTHPGVGLLGEYQLWVHDASHVTLHIGF